MRRQELRDEEERIQERKHMSFSNRTINPAGVEGQDISSTSHPVHLVFLIWSMQMFVQLIYIATCVLNMNA